MNIISIATTVLFICFNSTHLNLRLWCYPQICGQENKFLFLLLFNIFTLVIISN